MVTKFILQASGLNIRRIYVEFVLGCQTASYDLKDEQAYTKQIKDNYIKGFKLTAEGYSHITSYFETQNPNALNQMRDSFAEADKYFFKGMNDLQILKETYEDLISNKQYKDLQ